MKKYLVLFAVAATSLFSCNNTNQPFSIETGRVGKFHKEDQIKDIYNIFSQDSIVGDSLGIVSGNLASRVAVFEKGGAPLLTLNPVADSINYIGSIRVQDPRFKTTKGIGIESTYEQLTKNYSIDKIQTTFSSVIVSLKGEDFYVTIDRKELPEDLRYGSVGTIEAIQIPGSAPLKSVMISWQR
ncbi:MAG: hypothetical protein KIH80_008735 [Flavobacteriia bacterium]|nr:hypothetical protein [Flavobacteriia bacterium]